jgi:hypothetical protein
VDLSHFDGPAGIVPPRIAKRFVFDGDLARFASLAESGRARRTPVQCRKRPGRKQCRGLLKETGADLRRLELDPDAATRPVAVSVPARPRRRPKSTRRRAAEPKTFQIKVTRRNVEPLVWRRLIVPSDISLPALHEGVASRDGLVRLPPAPVSGPRPRVLPARRLRAHRRGFA